MTDKDFKYTDTMNFNESFAYFLFAGSGVLSLVTFFFLIKFAHKVKDFEMQLLALVSARPSPPSSRASSPTSSSSTSCAGSWSRLAS